MIKKLTAFIIIPILLLVGCEDSSRGALSIITYEGYIAETVLRQFEQRTGISVVYETAKDSDEMYLKILREPRRYDFMIAEDYLISRMLEEDALLPLESGALTNVGHINAEYKGLEFDPNNRYTLPYSAGIIGILYNTEAVEEQPVTWESLWSEENYGRVISPQDRMVRFGAAFGALEFSLDFVSSYPPEEAKRLLTQLDARAYRPRRGDAAYNMALGRASITVARTYEALNAISRCRAGVSLAFVAPEPRAYRYVDSMAILRGSSRVDEAAKLINHLCDPKMGLITQNSLNVVSTLREVRSGLSAEEQNSELLYPTAKILDRCEFLFYSRETDGQL